jgi:hypothetical protein
VWPQRPLEFVWIGPKKWLPRLFFTHSVRWLIVKCVGENVHNGLEV